jgi:hypothetical protein
MNADDVIGFCILSFLAGSLITMVLFAVLEERLEKRYRGQSES